MLLLQLNGKQILPAKKRYYPGKNIFRWHQESICKHESPGKKEGISYQKCPYYHLVQYNQLPDVTFSYFNSAIFAMHD